LSARRSQPSFKYDEALQRPLLCPVIEAHCADGLCGPAQKTVGHFRRGGAVAPRACIDELRAA